VLYLTPVIAAIGGSAIGLAGYAAGVTGRVLAARQTGGRVWPDALAHPASVAVLSWLTARSCHHRRAGTLTWKSRPITPAPQPVAAPASQGAKALSERGAPDGCSGRGTRAGLSGGAERLRVATRPVRPEERGPNRPRSGH
jgi:hypothetical protein